MPSTPQKPWTEDHLLIALNLYSKIPFGRFHKTNPALVEVAEKMGRTSGSLAMKLCNFASIDPVFLASGRKGLDGASRKDREMWESFHDEPERLGARSEQLLHDLITKEASLDVEIVGGDQLQLRPAPLLGPSEAMKLVSVRRGQSFFRSAVLAAYDARCCITGLAEPRLLEAAHIKAWSLASDLRHDPRNGLCLTKLHHGAFDAGLIAIDEHRRLMVSQQLRAHMPHPVVEESFLRYEGNPIARAVQNAEPNPTFFAWHRETMFVG